MDIDQSNKEIISEKIKKQIEFYLSDSNVRKDKFIQQLLKNEDKKIEDCKFIDLAHFIKFNRIKQLTSEIDDLKNALRKSEFLELSEDGTSVRRRSEIDFKKNINKSTIYVENLENNADHDWLNKLFSCFGTVVHVSLPRYKDYGNHKGFAFIEFIDEKPVPITCEFFDLLNSNKQNILASNNKSSSLIDILLNNLTVDEINEKQNFSNEKKRKNENLNDDTNKRIRIYDKTDHDKINNFKDLLQNITLKFEGNIHELVKLRVMSKANWIKYKKEYFNLKKKFNQAKDFTNTLSDETIMRSDESLTKVKRKVKKTEGKYFMKPGLILKLEYDKSRLPEEESLIKRTLREIGDYSEKIAYIDVRLTFNQCFLRFKDKQSVFDYSQQDKLNKIGKVTILEDLEEENYWSHIMKSLLDKKKKKIIKRNEYRKNNSENTHQNKELPINFKKGLIIRLQIDINLNNEPSEQELRKKIRSSVNDSYIAYIDQNNLVHNIFLSNELIRKTIFIRTKSIDCTKKLMENEKFKALGESIVLKDQEELDYWQYVKKCSQRKHIKKSNKK